MVESYPIGLTAEALAAVSQRADRVAAEMRVDGVEVRLVESTLVPAEDSLFCIFDAPSRAVVEAVVARAGMPLERLIEVVDVGPRPSLWKEGE
jgi:muconolactone delta-isomerase